MKIILALALVISASLARAADLTVTLTEDEAQTIISDMDIATKAGGLQIAAKALPIVAKLQQAFAAASAPKPEEKAAPADPARP